MKKIAMLAFTILLLSITALAKPIYKYVDKTPLSHSAALYNVREFYMDYNMSYSYIEVDLTDESTKITLLKSTDGVDALSTVKGLAQSTDNIIGALNADFFSNEGGGKGFSLGIEMTDGHLLESPIYPGTMATVFFGKDDVIMSYMDYSMAVKLPDGAGVKISHLNKHTAYYGDVLWYTHDWNGGMTKGATGNVAEYIFEDNELVEIRRNKEPAEIPENGFALVVDEGMNGGLLSLSVGDMVEIEVNCYFDLSQFDTAFGAGSMLVSEGQDVGKIGDYAHTVAGFHPRSAIGITEDKETLYLVAVDGRQTSSRGMRMSHVAELLIDLGCYYGVNLDGGGSTDMVAKDMWSLGFKSVNNPTENRKVINAVGVVLDGDDDVGEPYGIEVKSESDSVYVDDFVKVEAVVFDKYKRRAEFESQDVEWSATSGKIEDGIFYPDTSGQITVSASFDEFYADMIINVIDHVSGINTDKKIHLEVGDREKISLSVFDYVGNNVNIKDTSKFALSSTNEAVVRVEDGAIIAVGEGNAFVEVSKNDVKTYISVSVGSKSFEYLDSFEKNDRAFTLSPEDTKGSFEISTDFANSGNYSGKFTFDFTSPEPVETAEENELISLDETQSEDIVRAVYYNLSANTRIDSDCNEISLMVYAEKPFKHSLLAVFTDEKGKKATSAFKGEIEVGSWSKNVCSIPSELNSTVYLTAIALQHDVGEDKDEGSIYIDDLTFTSFESNTPKIAPSDIYRINNLNSNVTSVFRVGTLTHTDTPTPFSYHTDETVRAYLRDVSSSVLLGAGDKLTVSQDKNSYYIHIDTSKGGIRKTDETQWKTLAQLCEDSTKRNIFITCDTSIFGSDSFENEVILDYLKALDKEVFVIMSDNYSSYTDYGNLKLFTLDNSPATSILHDRNKAVNVIEFSFGDRVTFKFDKR